jgi:hypothetical protein
MEMNVVLRTMLRDFTLLPTGEPAERWHSRGVAYAPAKGGVAVVRPRAACRSGAQPAHDSRAACRSGAQPAHDSRAAGRSGAQPAHDGCAVPPARVTAVGGLDAGAR